MKLTLAKIKAAKPNPNQAGKHPRSAKYGDGRGLWLIVGPNGRKTWAFVYTLNKKFRHMGLGSIDYMSLDEARDKAVELRRKVKSGIDPQALLEDERKANLTATPSADTSIPTFKALAERYMDAKAVTWNDRTETNWRGTMRDYVFPAIGSTLVDRVTLEDVLTILRPIWYEKKEVASRVRGRIGVILSFAASKGFRPDDNITRARGPIDFELPAHSKGDVQNHDSMAYGDLPAFMTELRANKKGFAPRALEFLILTAARTGEALGATWGEVDLPNKVWNIPAARMKMKRDHLVPLSDAAVALIQGLQREIGNPYLFPSPHKQNEPQSNAAMVSVLKRMNRKDGNTVHGFRSTFRTWAAEKNLDIPREIAEAALAHSVQGVEGVYQRGTYLDTRRELMERWAQYTASEGEVA